MTEAPAAAITRIAASGGSLRARAETALAALRGAVGYDAAWLTHGERLRGRFGELASVNVEAPVCDLLTRSALPPDVAVAGADDARWSSGCPSRSLSDRDRSTWADSMTAGGVHHTLAIALETTGHRQVGYLVLFFAQPSPPSWATRRRLAALAPTLALAIDPLPALLATSRLVRGAVAGRVVRRDGLTEPLPGLADDPLLATGSPVLAAAVRSLGEGLVHTAYLWPLGGEHAPGGYVRISALAAPEDVPAIIAGTAFTSPPPHLHALTPRELEVLGLVVEGCSNREIARLLVVSPRTVAAHVEHVLVKLDVTTRTLAAVRAEREGLFVPRGSAPAPPER